MTSQTLHLDARLQRRQRLRPFLPAPISSLVPVNLLLGIVIIYPCFTELWIRWYPAWAKPDLSLWQRLTGGDSYYTHAPLVLLVSLAVALSIHRRASIPICRTRLSDLLGWGLLAVFSLLYLLGIAAEINFIAASALVGGLFSLTLTLGGLPLLRACWQPLALLVFMIPLPMVWLAGINYELKMLAADLAISVANLLPGVEAWGQGSYVFLNGPGTPAVGGEFLVIESVCSGLRSIITLAWFASLFAIFCQLRSSWRVVIVVLALPIAVISNIVRIAVMIAVASYSSVQTIGADTQLHQLVGLMTFVFALLLLVAFERAVLRLGDGMGQDWADARPWPRLGRVAGGSSLRFPHRRLFVFLLILAVGSILAARLRTNAGHPQQPPSLPVILSVDHQTYIGRDMPADPSDIALGSAHVVRKRYVDTRSGVAVDVILTMDNHGRGVHPPQVCLKGVGHTIESQRQILITPAFASGVACREMITAGDTHQRYHLFTYQAGRRWTTSFNAVQLTRISNKLLARPASTAMLRISAPVNRDDPGMTMRHVGNVARTLLRESLD